MKLGPNHISMIGVGVSAVAAIAMVLYYRNQATQAAATADTGSGMGAFPYFQTAALPSGVGGGSSGAVSANPNSASPSLDLNAVVSQGTFGNILETLAQNQQAAMGTNLGGTAVTRGYFTPTTGGGFNFGVLTLPYNTINIPIPTDFAGGHQIVTYDPAGKPVYNTDSTNSTPPPATVVH